jgi:hypothetical protein
MRHGGSGHAYVYYGCRCDECTDANRDRHQRKTRERFRLTAANGGIAPVDNHGRSNYRNWGCRCPICVEANAEYCRQRRQRTSGPIQTEGRS